MDKVPKHLLGKWAAFLLVLFYVLSVRDDNRNDPAAAVAYQADIGNSRAMDKLASSRTETPPKVEFVAVFDAL